MLPLHEELTSMARNTGWPIAIWAGLIFTPLLVGGGQVLFKIVGQRMAGIDADSFRSMLFDPYFFAAMAVYALATVAWILVLRVAPLGAAYSFMALGFLFVPLASWLLFGEALTLRYVTGAVLIMAGLTVIHA
jgi:undecaprenyl phosphate-alpha-L-ara4N flippase subunit ArnE